MERRIEELETKVALQERDIRELNNFLTAQQTQMNELEKKMELLSGRVKDLSRMADSMEAEDGEEPLPPHYLEHS